jgi:hypothetical protein
MPNKEDAGRHQLSRRHRRRINPDDRFLPLWCRTILSSIPKWDEVHLLCLEKNVMSRVKLIIPMLPAPHHGAVQFLSKMASVELIALTASTEPTPLSLSLASERWDTNSTPWD